MKNLPDFFRAKSPALSTNPYRDLLSLQRQMDRLFNDLWTGGASDFSLPAIESPAFAPSCDVDETDSQYLMSFDLPGVKKEDIKIDFNNGNLTVSGERKSEVEKKNKSSYRSERFYGSFSRSFLLPSDVKPEQVEAHYVDGVLKISIPKTKSSTSQSIKITEDKPAAATVKIEQEKRPSEKVA